MIKTTLFTLAFGLMGCTVHAHTPPPQSIHRPPPPAVRHASTPIPQNVDVRAWVWVSGYWRVIPGHQTRQGAWVHGYWDLRTVPRYMLSRKPHTHVRYVKGRRKPVPPPHRYR
jgi:hypothetical protein